MLHPSRRQFLARSAGAALASWSPLPFSWAAGLPRDLVIRRIVGFTLESKRPKMIGKNSRRDTHGDTARDLMVRLYTNGNIEGIGYCPFPEKAMGHLLGTRLSEFFDRPAHAMVSPLGAFSMPLWDLAGKVLKKPVYELLSDEVAREEVRVYDGSIYFADLLPEFAKSPLDRFKTEIDMGLDRGHRAFKVKIGRGAKWMEREAGDQRDIDVLRTIREHAGPDITIGVDANNGYDPERTRALLEALPLFRFAFLEEMFPEDVDDYHKLKTYLRARGFDALIADGETQRNVEPLKPLMRAQAIDVYQLDMRRMGFEGILEEAALARAHGGLVAPHNWGSYVGFHMQIHVGHAVDNFYMAEQDPATTDILVSDGYTVKEGRCAAPDTPGFGLQLDEEKFRSQVKVAFDIT